MGGGLHSMRAGSLGSSISVVGAGRHASERVASSVQLAVEFIFFVDVLCGKGTVERLP